MWDWTTSILKAQVRRRKRLKAGLLVPLGSSHTHPTPVPPRPSRANSSLSSQHDDQQSVVLRRRSSSDLARQKFGTMPLLPIRGDDSGATLLSANQTLVRPHPQHVLSVCSLSSFLPIAGGNQCACMPHAPPPHGHPLVHRLRAPRVPPAPPVARSHFVFVSPSPRPHPHSTRVQRRLHNRRTLSMFFVSIVLALAACLPAPCVCVPCSPHPGVLHVCSDAGHQCTRTWQRGTVRRDMRRKGGSDYKSEK